VIARAPAPPGWWGRSTTLPWSPGHLFRPTAVRPARRSRLGAGPGCSRGAGEVGPGSGGWL